MLRFAWLPQFERPEIFGLGCFFAASVGLVKAFVVISAFLPHVQLLRHLFLRFGIDALFTSCRSRITGLALMNSGHCTMLSKTIPGLGHMLGGLRERDGALNVGSNRLDY